MNRSAGRDKTMPEAMFQRQSALVFGACHRVARRVVLSLARKGAFIVAVDDDFDGLMDLASEYPEQIETLCLDHHAEERVAQLADAWAKQPLHILICAPSGNSSYSQLRRNYAMRVSRFSERLRQTKGYGALVFEMPLEAEGAAATVLRSERLANVSLVQGCQTEDRIQINGFEIDLDVSDGLSTARILPFLSPMMRGVNGAMLPIMNAPQVPLD